VKATCPAVPHGHRDDAECSVSCTPGSARDRPIHGACLTVTRVKMTLTSRAVCPRGSVRRDFCHDRSGRCAYRRE